MDILKKVGGLGDLNTGIDVVFIHGAEAHAKPCRYPKGHPELS